MTNTYRLWLRHELFRGRLDQNQFEFSEQELDEMYGEWDEENKELL